MAFKKENRQRPSFSQITISLASPDNILERSFGEVLKPETINYRTYSWDQARELLETYGFHHDGNVKQYSHFISFRKD